MSFTAVVWDECSLNNKYVFGFVLLSGVETLKHARKLMPMLPPEDFGEKIGT